MLKFLLVSAALVAFVVGHGSVHEPVARQSRWRYDPTATPNTNDYALNCGNFNVSYPVILVNITVTKSKFKITYKISSYQILQNYIRFYMNLFVSPICRPTS